MDLTHGISSPSSTKTRHLRKMALSTDTSNANTQVTLCNALGRSLILSPTQENTQDFTQNQASGHAVQVTNPAVADQLENSSLVSNSSDTTSIELDVIDFQKKSIVQLKTHIHGLYKELKRLAFEKTRNNNGKYSESSMKYIKKVTPYSIAFKSIDKRLAHFENEKTNGDQGLVNGIQDFASKIIWDIVGSNKKSNKILKMHISHVSWAKKTGIDLFAIAGEIHTRVSALEGRTPFPVMLMSWNEKEGYSSSVDGISPITCTD